jgi:lipid II:glycine glycyltransferase (peptidoglycan interpeptide bridge formation enzyme)
MNVRVSLLEHGEADEASSFLQSEFWGDFKAESGWRPLRFVLEAEHPGTGAQLLLLLRRLPAGFSFAYVPHGPEMDIPAAERAAFLSGLSDALRPYLPRGCLFVRFDPPWYSCEEAAPSSQGADDEAGADSGAHSLFVEELRPAIGAPLRRAAADVQPPDTVLVDLRPSEGAILAAM